MLMEHDGKLSTCPFQGPLFTMKKVTMEQLLQINNKHGSRTKYFNRYTDI